MSLLEKIKNKSVKVAVIGLGYVGLPLAVEFAREGVYTLGVDVDPKKIKEIAAGRSYIPDVKTEDVKSSVDKGVLDATTDFSRLKEIDAIFICVPTPFTKAKAPDISYVVNASEQIAQNIKKGQMIILQSTTYPGTTEEDVQPILESSGLKAGADFYLAFSPERIDPGNKLFGAKNTPKVVGGITKECTDLAAALFALIIGPDKIHKVSGPKSAEMCKLLENIFRSVNIALVNELTLLSDRMGIDIWEVIDAAATKPFGYMPFYPGPGVGGHCIPVDPYYLSWKAREYDFYTKFIELAAEVNQSMPFYTVNKLTEVLNRHGKTLKDAKVLVLGAAFKRDIDDARNSPALEVLKILYSKGVDVCYNDPFVPKVNLKDQFLYTKPIDRIFTSMDLSEQVLGSMDCVLIAVKHSSYNFPWIVKHSQLILDAQNATKGIIDGIQKVVKI